MRRASALRPWPAPSGPPWSSPLASLSRRSRPSSVHPWPGRGRRCGSSCRCGSLGSGVGASRLRQGRSGLAGSRLGALCLVGLRCRDTALGGLGGLRLARGLRHSRRGLHLGAARRRVELEGQAGLAARGGVRVDRAALGGPVESRMGLSEGGRRDDRVGLMGRDIEGLRDERLRGGATGLKDFVPALGLADALQSRRRASARPGAGRLGQGATSRERTIGWSPGTHGAEHGRAW